MTRRFQMHLADGRTLHGAEFPSGQVAINHPTEPMGPFTVALSINALTGDLPTPHPLYDARVEWIDNNPSGP